MTNLDPPRPTDGPDAPLWRVCDAASNRALEGLRVIEDVARFVHNDRFLTERLKTLRHMLAEAITQAELEKRLTARDTLQDVGVAVQPYEPARQRSLAALVTGNFRRVQEALRSLEEIAPLALPDLAARFQAARYEAYTLERAITLSWLSRRQLPTAQIYALVDARDTEADFAHAVTRLVEAGVDLIQLRTKMMSDRELLARGQRLVQLTRDSHTLALINDRADVALAAGADGVHLGQEDLPIFAVRQLLGAGLLIGVSTHSAQQAADAVLAGANYLGVGPTFPSATKPFERYPGLALLRSVAAQHGLPAFAIGGIDRDNIHQVAESGFRRVAIQSAFARTSDLKGLVAELRDRLGPVPEVAAVDAKVDDR